MKYSDFYSKVAYRSLHSQTSVRRPSAVVSWGFLIQENTVMGEDGLTEAVPHGSRGKTNHNGNQHGVSKKKNQE